MIDMHINNSKLKERAVNIIMNQCYKKMLKKICNIRSVNSITMIQNKQKFKNGIRKIALAVPFYQDILFVLSSHSNHITNALNLGLSIIGLC